MASRSKLKSQLKQAWKNTISKRYNKQLINSEAGLQAYFCAELLTQLKGPDRRIFIQPCLSFSNKKRRHPDVVICSSQRIIGIVELKYVPRGSPEKGLEKDLKTLQLAAEAGKELTISNDRYRGKRLDDKDKKYTLAPDAVLCWAGVYTGPAKKMKESEIGMLGRRFLQLDARTRLNENAIVGD